MKNEIRKWRTLLTELRASSSDNPNMVRSEDSEYVYLAFNERGIRALERELTKHVNDIKKKFDAEGESFLSLKSIARSKDSDVLDGLMEGDDDPKEEDDEYASAKAYLQDKGVPEDQVDDRVSMRKQLDKDPDFLKKKRRDRGNKKDFKKGQMQTAIDEPEKLERMKYVIPISKSAIKQVEEMMNWFRNEAVEVYNDAKNWYRTIHETIDTYTDGDDKKALFGLLIAVYSPVTAFATNIAEATLIYKSILADEAKSSDDLVNFLCAMGGITPQEAPTENFLKRVGALKVTNFSLNILAPELAKSENGEGINPLYRWNSTIDTWILNAFYPSLRGASSKKMKDFKSRVFSDPVDYTYVAEALAKVAEKQNLLPQECQAIIWVALKGREEGIGAADPWKTIGAAIKNTFEEAKKEVGAVSAEIEQELSGSDDPEVIGDLMKVYDQLGPRAAGRVNRGYSRDRGDDQDIQGVAGLDNVGSTDYVEYPLKEAGLKGVDLLKSLGVEYEHLDTYEILVNWTNGLTTMRMNGATNVGLAYLLGSDFSVETAVKWILAHIDTSSPSAAGSLKSKIKEALLLNKERLSEETNIDNLVEMVMKKLKK